MTSPFAQSYAALVANGYHVIPIGPGSKAPSLYSHGIWRPMTNWQRFRAEPANELQLKIWAQWPDANIGILTGTPAGDGWLACVDFDTDDFDTLEQLQETLPQALVAKRGKRGHSAFYRVPVGTKGFRTPIVELLTDTRQTVIPPSIHPDLGAPYQFTTKETLLTVPAHALTSIH